MKTIVKRAMDIPENTLEGGKVRIPGIVYVETYLLDNIRDIRLCECQILISNRRAIRGGQLGISINKSGTRLAFVHVSTLKDLNVVLMLTQKKPSNSDPPKSDVNC
uniref:Uncharacterized protein n=1 Tax=Oryza sativa subsp. japonica TaxID=39947 RepID=H2KWQ5_ORYSJ|nr:hypothetical protein LOC_Os12g13209 [Oryza sativa Japonica Group]